MGKKKVNYSSFKHQIFVAGTGFELLNFNTALAVVLSTLPVAKKEKRTSNNSFKSPDYAPPR